MTTDRFIPLAPPDISAKEIEEVINALKSGWITTGSRTKLFEQEIADYIGVRKAVCVNSATAAMELILRILEVGPGDEVITTAYTYTASASVIDHVGAKVVLVDVAPESYEMDMEKLAAAITERTKAIIPVDIGGKICDYQALFSVIEAKKHLFKAESELQKRFNRIVILADAAHAFGAVQKGVKCGHFADFSCFSFHAVKNLTTAEGGAIVWANDCLDDAELYRKLRIFSLHGQTKDALEKSQGGEWEYDIVFPAYKCNMTDIQAALGLAQLQRYDGLLARRREIIAKYDRALSPLGLHILQHKGDDYTSSGHLYLVRVPGIDVVRRNEIIVRMAEAGVACNVHYKPLPMFTAYRRLGFRIDDYPNAYSMYENEITIPLHTLLSDDDVDYVVGNFSNIIKTI